MPGRESWLEKAVECFNAQTYQPRTMLILLDDQMAVPGLMAFHDLGWDAPITSYRTAPMLIGPKRNFMCDAALGKIICHFDDDDHSAPTRIEDQVRRLRETGKMVTGYHTMKFTDGEKWWLYQGHGNMAMGTSLCYYRSWWKEHPFPEEGKPAHVGEDGVFASLALNERQFISVSAISGVPKAAREASDLMVATIHNQNTSKRNTAPACWVPLS